MLISGIEDVKDLLQRYPFLTHLMMDYHLLEQRVLSMQELELRFANRVRFALWTVNQTTWKHGGHFEGIIADAEREKWKSFLFHFRAEESKKRVKPPRLAADPYEFASTLGVQGLPWGLIPIISDFPLRLADEGADFLARTIWSHRGRLEGDNGTDNQVDTLVNALLHEQVFGIEFDLMSTGRGEDSNMQRLFLNHDHGDENGVDSRDLHLAYPSFEDLIQKMKALNIPPDKTMNIEIKVFEDQGAVVFADMLGQIQAMTHGLQNPIIISSGHPKILDYRAKYPDQFDWGVILHSEVAL